MTNFISFEPAYLNYCPRDFALKRFNCIQFFKTFFFIASTNQSSYRSQSTRERWYVDIDCATVDEYTSEQDTMNETTEDELGERLVELEKKTVITNDKLQQLTDLVERMTSQ